MFVITRLAIPSGLNSVSRRAVGRACGAVVLVAVAAEAVRVLARTNRHTVVPGRVYRCAQPSAADLRELADRHGIRTVVNLRGPAPDPTAPESRWYLAEATANHDLNVSQEDVTFSANRLPPPAELRRLIDVLDRTEYPVLIHCKRGADRTGLASAVVLLLQTDATLSEARRQLWPRYGHFRFGRTAAIDDFFDRYEAWLTSRGTAHSPAQFREWATTAYTPGPAVSELEWLAAKPVRVRAGKPFAVALRATNRSAEAWEFRPGNYAGIHLYYVVADEANGPLFKGQAGLFRKTVLPGESIELTATVPAIAKPGKYVLGAELHDARGAGVPIRAGSFVQYGDRAVLTEVVVE